MSLLGQDLNRAVLIDGNGAGGDEVPLGVGLLVDGDDAGLQDGERGDVLGEDTERAGERGNVHL